MRKVFLTNPPLNMAETPLQYHRPLAPLGLAYLGGLLEDRVTNGGWSRYVGDVAAGRTSADYVPSGRVAAQDNMFLSFYDSYSYDRLRRTVEAFCNGDEDVVIGLSVLSDGAPAAMDMLGRLRTDFPGATLVVGGPHATAFPQSFCQPSRNAPVADYVVRNEGELALIGIADGLLADADLLRAHGPGLGIDPNACDYAGDTRIIDGGQYGQRESAAGARHVLDTLPPPAYFLFEDAGGAWPYEPDDRYGLPAPAANINSSRGCPHKCTFCTIPTLVPGYRTLSPERMLEQVAFLTRRYDVRSIFFREDNFIFEGRVPEEARWPDVEAFCDRVQAVAPGLRWAIEARADNLMEPASATRSRIEVLRDAGLSGVYIGVESGSDAMLKLYVKGSTVGAISEAIKACGDAGVAVVATAVYGDPDLFLRRNYPLIDLQSDRYLYAAIEQREQILGETRAFLDLHGLPLDRREEYALLGIPVSAAYRLLDRERHSFPALIEHADPVTRYLYPKGFNWWAQRVYELRRRVRPFISFSYQPAVEQHPKSF